MENIIDKNYLIIGFGISGQGAYTTLKEFGANVFIYDEDIKKISNVEAVKINKLTKKIIKDMDCIILSPTVQLNKSFTKFIDKMKVDCYGELEFAYRQNKGNILAITGSNGKTTTSLLLKELLDTLPNKTYLLGNIGKSFSEEVINIDEMDNVVLECSSFQLKQTIKFHPHIACLLNLVPDHLDFHKSLEDYYDAKLKIFANQNEDDYAIVNFDDKLCVEKTKNLQAQVYYFSTKSSCRGMFIADDTILFSDGIITYPIVKLENIRYIGEHNLSNYLCASLMAMLQGVSIENIAYVLNNFKTPAHRLEFVRRFHNIDFYNDSKATNISAMITACKAFDKNIHLLLGGSDKGEDFDILKKTLPKNVKYVYVFGQTQNKLYKSLKKVKNLTVYKCDNLKNAVNFSAIKALKGEVVLLSPACASFDAFLNFEDRGNYFKDLVNNFD